MSYETPLVFEPLKMRDTYPANTSNNNNNNNKKMERISEQKVHEHVTAFIATIQSDALWISEGNQILSDHKYSVMMMMTKCNAKDLRSALGIGEGVWPPSDVAMFPLIKDGYWSLLVIYRSRGTGKMFHYDPTSSKTHAGYSKEFVRMMCFAGLFPGKKRMRIKRVAMDTCSAPQTVWRILLMTQQILSAGSGGGLTPFVGANGSF